MNAVLVAWSLACAAGLSLSLRSAAVVRFGSPWTLAGWLASAAYCAFALTDLLRHTAAPFHLDYAILAAMTGAFVMAGVRDERQGEPWWWPARAGLRGRERRAGLSARPPKGTPHV